MPLGVEFGVIVPRPSLSLSGYIPGQQAELPQLVEHLPRMQCCGFESYPGLSFFSDGPGCACVIFANCLLHVYHVQYMYMYIHAKCIYMYV